MLSFGSFGTVLYSPSIVTMAVYVAVCDIFNVKEWTDLGVGLGFVEVIGNCTK